MLKAAATVIFVLATIAQASAAWSGKYDLILIVYSGGRPPQNVSSVTTMVLGTFPTSRDGALQDCISAANAPKQGFNLPNLANGEPNLYANLLCVPTN